jgi:predicted phosphodiesterase
MNTSKLPMINLNAFAYALKIMLLGCLILGISFNTADADDRKLKFGVISDHKHDFEGLNNALEFVVSQNVDFLVVVGDFSPLADAYLNHYTSWGFEVREDLQPENQNLFFVMGNHDSPPSGNVFFRTNIAPFYPHNGLFGAPQGTIFSFEAENTHLVITNQYVNYPRGGYTSPQLKWIDQDLKTSQQPFKFVFGHEPAFPLDRHVGDSLDIDPSMRDEFWDILSENEVQAFFCGHTHHLSVIKSEGVYQIDSGEVTSTHLSIVLVEISSETAIARLFETDGSMPETKDGDNVFDTYLVDRDNGDEAYTIVFSSDKIENDPWWGCFIETIVFKKRPVLHAR